VQCPTMMVMVRVLGRPRASINTMRSLFALPVCVLLLVSAVTAGELEAAAASGPSALRLHVGEGSIRNYSNLRRGSASQIPSVLVDKQQQAIKRTGRQRRRKLEDGDDVNKWWEKYENDDDRTWFDDDEYKQYEQATRTNFWSMFTNPPAAWTARQWGVFAGFLMLMSICICCACKVLVPCC